MNSITKEAISFSIPIQATLEMALPVEIFKKILTHLNPRDTQSASLVSKTWYAAIIDTAQHEQFSSIKSFVLFLCDHLDEKKHSTQISKLKKIVSENLLLNSENLIEVKKKTKSLTTTIAIALKKLSSEELEKLKDASHSQVPRYLANVFNLTELYQTIQQASPLSDQVDPANKLLRAAISFAEQGYSKRALKIVKSISHSSVKKRAFRDLALAHLNKSSYEKAVNIAKEIPNKKMQSETLFKILKVWADAGFLKEALMWKALTLQNTTCAVETIGSIFLYLLETNRLEKVLAVLALEQLNPLKDAILIHTSQCVQSSELAIIMTDLISDVVQKNRRFLVLCFLYYNKGLIKDALQVALAIHDSSFQHSTLRMMFRSIMETTSFENAFAHVNLHIPDGLNKEMVFKSFADILIERNQLADAEKLISQLTEGHHKNGSWSSLALAYEKKEDLFNSLRVAATIPETNLRSNVLIYIFKKLISASNAGLTTAWDLVGTMPVELRSPILLNLGKALILLDHHSEALKTVDALPTPELKASALKYFQNLLLENARQGLKKILDSNKFDSYLAAIDKLDPVRREQSLKNAVENLLYLGELEKAELAANKITDIEKKTALLQQVAAASQKKRPAKEVNPSIEESDAASTCKKQKNT